VNPDFFVAVRVTVVGMLLVFGTLVICALVIKGLSAIFKVKPEEDVEEEPLADPLAFEPAPPAQNLADEAAAVALAIAATLVSRKKKVAAAMAAEPEIIGEWAPSTVVVLSADAGAGTWNSAGKLKATS
jgi:Na+-transporting methylmalonyl-CoA/oxaloacetate decarboxylase gamma subunit